MTDNPLWARIQQYMDDPSHRYPPKPADLARETGVSEQVLSKWKGRAVLPKPLHLMAFSAGTGIPYEELLIAVLNGRGYIPDVEAPSDAKLVLSPRMRYFVRGLGERLIHGEPKTPYEESGLTDTPEHAEAAHEEEESVAGEAEKLSGQ